MIVTTRYLYENRSNILKPNSRVYVAGPMRGIKSFNYPKFEEATADLRARGYSVVSPAELDDETTYEWCLASPDGQHLDEIPSEDTWGDCLVRDIKIVIDKVDGVAVLPGWHKSTGARGETFFAYLCQKPIVYWPDLQAVPAVNLMSAWLGELRLREES
jgi:hypothetical protein